MRKVILAAALSIGALMLALRSQAAAPADLQWHYEDAPGTVFALANGANSTFAAGLLEAAGPNFTDWHVQAYDSRSGEVLWQDTYDRAARPDAALAIAADGLRVVAGGYVHIPGPGGNFNWFVRAYDARSGDVLWDHERDGSSRDQVLDVELAGGLVVAAGALGDESCLEQGFGNCDFVVTVYDAATGGVRWQDRHDGHGQYDEAAALAVQGDRLFVAGSVSDAIGFPDMHVRAYELQTGSLLWSSTYDAGMFDVGRSLAVIGSTVVIGGFGGANCLLFDVAPDCDAIVQAYDASTGELLWQFDHDEAGDFDEAFAVAAGSELAFGAGRVTDDAGAHMATFALDLATGDVVWQDIVELDTGESSLARAVALQGTSLIVVGGGGPDCVGAPISDCDIIVRAYDSVSGALRWWDRYDGAEGDDVANAVAIHGNRVIVGGSVAPSPGQPAPWAVRAYRDVR